MDHTSTTVARAAERSVEVREVAEALRQAGNITKTFGVEFAETNSLAQLPNKLGKKDSEGSIALRNTTVKLQALITDAIK